MAKFAIGDWVKILPTPDTRSDVWTSSHNKFCDKIGEVVDINDMYDDMLLIRVSVTFNYKLDRLSGDHSEWFEDKHLIKSSKWEQDRATYLSEKFEEYKKFEISSKIKRDKILKHIFTDHEAKKREEEVRKAIDEIRKIEEPKDMEGWVVGDGWFAKDFDDF